MHCKMIEPKYHELKNLCDTVFRWIPIYLFITNRAVTVIDAAWRLFIETRIKNYVKKNERLLQEQGLPKLNWRSFYYKTATDKIVIIIRN